MRDRDVAVLILDTWLMDPLVFHHDIIGDDDPTSYFTVSG